MKDNFFKVEHDLYGRVIEAYKGWKGVSAGSFNMPSGVGIEVGGELIKALEKFVYDPLRGLVPTGRDSELKIILGELYVAFEKANDFAVKYGGGEWLVTRKAKVDSLAEKIGLRESA